MKFLTSLLFVLTLATGLFAADAPKRPNILLILADDMGYSDAHCYGGDIATPNLDKLAADGLRFTQFYNTSRCWPSRAAILTGYYAQEVRRDTVPGVQSGGRGIRPAWAQLLPVYLRTLGYRNYHSGKWHLDGKPMQNGFDHSYDLEDHNRNFNPKNLFEDDVALPPVPPGTGYYTSTAFADHAIQCLKEHAEKYADRPFFEYLAFTVPHFPLQAPAADIAKYKDKYLKGWDTVRKEHWERLTKMGMINTTLSPMEREVGPPYDFPKDLKQLGPNEINRPVPWTELTDSQKEYQATKMAIHAAMIDRMDQEIGRVLGQVHAMGADNDTIVIFLSDNGASAEMMVRGDGNDLNAAPGSGGSFLCLGPGWSSASNAPFRRHKTWVHEGGIATPFIVRWPAGISAKGELRQNPSHIIDILPTLLDAAGGKAPDTWEGKPVPERPGRSLVPVFAKDNSVPHDYFWWQHEGNRAFRVGNWKIVAAGAKSPWELYDVSKDRAESNDLASQNPEKVQELERMWNEHTAEFRALAVKNLPPDALKKKAPGAPEAD